MRAILALPETPDRRPGVIVIHEAFGLNRDMREKCERLADLGYVALAPDLYDDRGPMPICMIRAMRSLNAGNGPAFDDLDAARAHLATRPEVDASRIGVIGFCVGGGFALLYAARAPLQVAAVFYGPVPKEPDALDDVCPIVAGYGGRDRIFGPQARRLDRRLTEIGVPHDVRTYADAGHSFMSDHHGILATLNAWGPMKVGFNLEAAEHSWRRVEAFLAEHLGVGDSAGSRSD